MIGMIEPVSALKGDMIDFVTNLTGEFVEVVLWRRRVVGGGRMTTTSVRVGTVMASALTTT